IIPDKFKDDKKVRKILLDAYLEKDLEYIRRNISYSNKNAKKNYISYLTKALKADWASAEEEQKATEKMIKEQEQKEAKTNAPDLTKTSDEILKYMAEEVGNKVAQAELIRREKEAKA
ncbi:MAG: hypothetical protein ACQESP_13030, partial [Candidatus Muiribacteriota bacterium]